MKSCARDGELFQRIRYRSGVNVAIPIGSQAKHAARGDAGYVGKDRYFLQIGAQYGIKFSQIRLIEQVEQAWFAGRDQEMGMRRRTHRIRKKDHARRTQVDVASTQHKFVRWGEEVEYSPGAGELYNGIRIVDPARIGVKDSVRGFDINVAVGIRRRASTRLPDRSFIVSTGRIGG